MVSFMAGVFSLSMSDLFRSLPIPSFIMGEDRLAAKQPALSHGKVVVFSLKSWKAMAVMKSSPMDKELVKALPTRKSND